MITKESQAARDRIREVWATCGGGHPLNVVCGTCNALAIARGERNRVDIEAVYKLEREAEAVQVL